MPTATITPADLTAVVATQLDGWDQQTNIVIDVEGCRLSLAPVDSIDEGLWIHVEHVGVPRYLRRAGYGDAVMTALTDWADRQRLPMDLEVSGEFGTPAEALTCFYQKHGFGSAGWYDRMERYPNTTGEAE